MDIFSIDSAIPLKTQVSLMKKETVGRKQLVEKILDVNKQITAEINRNLERSQLKKSVRGQIVDFFA